MRWLLLFLELIFGLFLGFAQASQNQILSLYSHLDPQRIVPRPPLIRLLMYYDKVKHRLKNPNYTTVIDFTPHHSQLRMHIIDMRSGVVTSHLVAHGIGSDPNKTGFARFFSNTIDSLQSSLGIIRTGETYHGIWGYSLRLDGLEPSNNRLRRRSIVLHAADYVNPVSMGWSDGCFAVSKEEYVDIINRIEGGSLMIAWVNPEALVPRQGHR